MRKHRSIVNMLIVITALLLAGIVSTQAQQTMNNDSVIELIKSGLSEDLIITTINASPGAYNTSVDGLIALKGAGVSEKVLAAIVNRASGGSVAATAANTAVAGSNLPPGVDTVGVFYKNPNGTWHEMNVEIVNFKTGGVMKGIVTQGLVKGDLNGNIKGPKSRLALRKPAEFILYLPEGRTAGEYMLLRLRPNKKEREFRAVTGGIIHSSSGATRDVVEFASERIAPRAYAITLSGNIGEGEYGFLPQYEIEAGSVKSGRMYTFSLTP